MSSDEECYNEYDMDKDCQDTFRRSREGIMKQHSFFLFLKSSFSI